MAEEELTHFEEWAEEFGQEAVGGRVGGVGHATAASTE